MLSLPSQLLLRNSEHFNQGQWAFINPSEADVFNQLENANIVGLHQLFHQFSDCERFAQQAQFFDASFQLSDLDMSAFDGVVIYMPKSKQHLAMLIDNAAAIVKANGVVLVVGENKAGIKSVGKMLEKIGSQVNKIDSAKHCGLYAVTVIEPAPSFDIEVFKIIRSYNINEQEVQVYSLPGVFGHKQLDPGTAMLLEQFTTEKMSKVKGEFYDFACGTGVIAAYFGLAANKYKTNIKMTMSDISALAIYCSQKTMQLNQLEAAIMPCDGVVEVNKRFDVIVSNPPFHDGIKNDYQITEDFIKQSFRRSVPYASITIVANKFLPYPDILEEVYQGFSELASSNKFTVYEAIRPKTKAWSIETKL